MSLRDLPKSLIDSVATVLEKSNETHSTLKNKIVAEGLKKFGVKSVSELSEADKKALHAWVQIKLNESSCACGATETVCEDDMPGDEVFHKDGEESGEKKKEIDEEDLMAKDPEEVSEALNVGSIVTRARVVLLLSKGDVVNIKTSDGKTYKNVTLTSVVGAKHNYLGGKLDDPLGGKIEFKSENGTTVNLIGNKIVNIAKLNESISIAPDELATNGAVGVRDVDSALPIHADVLRDSNPVDGSTELRLFVQWPTNVLPQIIPPPTLPGAKTLDALRELCSALPYYSGVIESALTAAAEVPSESDKNVVTEATKHEIKKMKDEYLALFRSLEPLFKKIEKKGDAAFVKYGKTLSAAVKLGDKLIELGVNPNLLEETDEVLSKEDTENLSVDVE